MFDPTPQALKLKPEAAPAIRENETVALLRKARALIADENGWCQGQAVRYAKGKVQYCAIGALTHVNVTQAFLDHVDIAAQHLYDTNIVTVNDVAGHAAVLRCFDLAIERASASASV